MKSMTTIYFSKMNLSSHIYDVYDAPNKEEKLNDILKDIYIHLKDGVFYEDHIMGTDKHGEMHTKEITYKLVQLESMLEEELTTVGRMVKTSTLITTKYEDGTITKNPVSNDEIIDFYFDIGKEIIAYNRSSRFGHKDINDAFEKIFNKLFEDAIINNPEQEVPYYVYFENIREGISIENIKNELYELGKIQELTLEIIPPNANRGFLNNMDDGADNYIDDLKSAKITHRKLVLTSRDAAGLQLDDVVVQNEIDKIDRIHSKLSSEEAVENGYVFVQAYNQNGESFSTRKSKVRTAIIEEPNSLIEFARRCKEKIRRLIMKNQNEEGS